PTAPPTAQGAPTAAPAGLGAGAITIDNVDTITQTREITNSVFGPVAFSPDGTTLAVGVSAMVSMVDADTLDSRAQLTGHAGRVTSLAWSADGALLASGASDDNDIRVWDAGSDTLKHTLSGHTGWVRSLAFSPDGTTLASGSVDQTIKLWDAENGTLLHTLSGHTAMLGGLAFSPDGAYLASGSRDGSVRLWEVASGTEVSGFNFQAPINPDTTARYWTTGVAFAPDGASIAVGATDGVVYILDARTGEQQRQLQGHTNWIVIRGVAYAPDGKTLYSASLDGTVRLWDTSTGEETGQLRGHNLDVFAISLSADGARLASASDQEGRLLVWDLAARRPVDSLRVGQGIVTSLAFSPDSAVLGSVGYNGILQLRLLADDRGRALAGSVAATQALAFLPNGRLATVTDQETVVLLDIGQENSAELEGLSAAPLSVVASADGSLLASGTVSGTVTLWDGNTGTVRGELRGDLPSAVLLAVSDDGRLLAVAGPPTDPRIEIWDVARERVLHTLVAPEAPITALAFRPNGALLAATSLDGALRLYDGEDGLELRTIRAAPEHGWFAGMAFAPDGALIATGSPTGAIQFWNPDTGAEIASVQQDFGVIAMAFSPDGERLVVSARDATVRLYEVP
ncbi:MAG TPA: WD40 repeat domain-containing protein, partial [Roseiflexaceae bacterium]|nr:WD40 repeat domain-containing protein [Roseiflexaceae bacterium]